SRCARGSRTTCRCPGSCAATACSHGRTTRPRAWDACGRSTATSASWCAPMRTSPASAARAWRTPPASPPCTPTTRPRPRARAPRPRARGPPPDAARPPRRDARGAPPGAALAARKTLGSRRIRLSFVDFAGVRRYPARHVSVLNTKVLVLNRSYLPIHITVVRRALSLLYQGIAHAVDEQYRTFDFESWADLAAEEDRIGLVDRAIRAPRVILLQGA